MINTSSLTHPNTKAKLDEALKLAVSHSVVHIDNKKGKAFLAVRYRPNLGRVCKPFVFHDVTGRDVSDVVYKVLRAA